MCKFKRTLLPLALLSCFKFVYLQPSTAERDTLTEHPGGTVINDKIVFSKSQSPYWLRNDLIVEFGAELVIEPGVTVKIEPQVGITVRGILTAEVSRDSININKLVPW
ncbi:unnamed protein product [Diabrotica balteata]|uniref:G8 domain-containing protein n=1 Tax=Diabrotica balteata TaxID=107213 RepID=A0A9N9XGX8_DIABA|nr:unnamed protein product [Diabrotica balteata]